MCNSHAANCTRKHLAALPHAKNTKLFGILGIKSTYRTVVIVAITTQIIQRSKQKTTS